MPLRSRATLVVNRSSPTSRTVLPSRAVICRQPSQSSSANGVFDALDADTASVSAVE